MLVWNSKLTGLLRQAGAISGMAVLGGVFVWCWRQDQQLAGEPVGQVQARAMVGPRAIPPVRLEFPQYSEVVVGDSAELQQSHKQALDFAVERFAERGGSYQFGPNDCSTFVSDYLEGLGAPLRSRLTTKSMMDPGVARQVGLKPVSAQPGAGDILVFRYFNLQGELRGHCGVLTMRDGELLVKHNSLRYGGVVEEPYESFRRFFESSGRLEQFAALRFVN